MEHAVEVAADTLYEAVAQGLRVFRANAWVNEIGDGRTVITVKVKQPEVEHKVQVGDLEKWLDTHPRSPAEMSMKNRIRELLQK
jgi:hypothetical protein